MTVDFKGLFKGLTKSVLDATSGKWGEVAVDAQETLSAVGLATEPAELAFLLIHRSLEKALSDLTSESANVLQPETGGNPDAALEALDLSTDEEPIFVDRKFRDRPSDLPLVKRTQALFGDWLLRNGVDEPAARVIADRLPSYFVYAIAEETRRNAKSYRPLFDVLDGPFAFAGERELAWTAYSALLERRIDEGIFDEPFGLRQMYIPLNAFYLEDLPAGGPSKEKGSEKRRRRRVVVSLREELENWLRKAEPHDAIRVISGGPGCGKSSFARMFAVRLSTEQHMRVLYIPLHLIDPTKDLADEIGRFVKDEGVLYQNPLDPDSPEPNLLVILDGLDELASQGKAAAETGRAFAREVERTVGRRNSGGARLRVLISGREVVVQENESEFRRPGQVLTLLPYFAPQSYGGPRHSEKDEEEYYDPQGLLEDDLRQQWWRNYGTLTGRGYAGLPEELGRDDLAEITAQPLLNYLLALSFTRNKLDFTRNINLNEIYADLVEAVHDRGYDKHRPYGPIRHMGLSDFARVLEEIGLAAWHGDGRTTTVSEIEEHCRASGLTALLDAFQEGAKAGVTRLLAAFFFRQYGQRTGGDRTFIFTHKSFGEYLTARRVVRAIEKIVRELERRAKDADEGWSEQEALEHWARVCGPSAVSPYLHFFLLNEVKLRPVESLLQWQNHLATLFSHMLEQGMPMHRLPTKSFKESLFQSRNAEEALLVALNACARVTEQVSSIQQSSPTEFGAWFKRIQGQRDGDSSVIAAGCLSFLGLSGACLETADLYGANLDFSQLSGLMAHFACLDAASLEGVGLRKADLGGASLRGAGLQKANLTEANLREANLTDATLRKARLVGADLRMVNLTGADLRKARFTGASLGEAVLKGANLARADLREADLREADLRGTDLREADLRGADLRGADLREADLRKANIQRAKLQGADLQTANLAETILTGANPVETILPEEALPGRRVCALTLGPPSRAVESSTELNDSTDRGTLA